MDNLSANDSLLQGEIASQRTYQSYSPATSCSLSTSGSTYSLSSSPNSLNSYGPGMAHEGTPPSGGGKRRGSEPVISQYTHHYHRRQNSPEYLNSSLSDENNASMREAELGGARPVNRFFPDGVVDILNKWFYENQSYPYPDEGMTNVLAKEANISAKQVRKWFANKRVRSNKCYKQTFRVRKDLQQPKVHINRRQTKSVSDGETLLSNQMNYYDDAFEDEKPEINSRSSYHWSHGDHMSNISSSGSSASSSPPSYNIYNSPIIKGEPTFYQPEGNKFPNGHHNIGMSHSYSLSSFEQLQQNAASSQSSLAALYNPLFLMNILQNPSMALQAVLANRLISLNNSDNTNDQVNDLNHSIQSTPIQKRKTHLSNRFHNESFNSKASNLHLIQEVPNDIHHINSVKSEETNGSGGGSARVHTNAYSEVHASNLKDLLIAKTNQNDSTCSNKSVRSSFSLDELSTSINSTHFNQSFTNQAAQQHQQQQQQSVPKPVKKINFGDISSLI